MRIIEYVLFILIGTAIMAAVGGVLVSRYYETATSPKVSFEIVRLMVVNDGNGLYLDMQASSTTNTNFCINFIEFYDPATDRFLVAGDGVNEASNLPICIRPGQVFKISLYHQLTTSGFSPGRRIMLKFYYSTLTPSTTFTRDDPQHIIIPVVIVAG